MKYETVLGSATAQAIANGDSIKVYKINISSTTGGTQTVTLFERDGGTIIFSATVSSNAPNIEIGTEFMAKNGLAVTTTSLINCTIFYTQSGA